MLELKQKLTQLCNQSRLPIDAVYFVLKDLYRDAEEALRYSQEQSKNTPTPPSTQEEEGFFEIPEHIYGVRCLDGIRY